MHKMNGIEATQTIRAKMPDVVVIGLSMYTETHRAEEMRQAGAAVYIAKTEMAETLVAAIHVSCRK